jgi:HAD superfamily hydrolase (TIGR01509 family)
MRPPGEVRAALGDVRIAAYEDRIGVLEYRRAVLSAHGVTAEESFAEGLIALEQESEDIEPAPGVTDAIPALAAAGVGLAIVTDTVQPLHTKRAWLTRIGLQPEYFGAIVSSVEVGHSKPHPRIYQAALERLGVEASVAGFVGHATDELEGAAALGLCTIAFRPDEPDVAADATIDDLRLLIDLVRSRRA